MFKFNCFKSSRLRNIRLQITPFGPVINARHKLSLECGKAVLRHSSAMPPTVAVVS